MTKQEEIREGLSDIFSTIEGGRGGANYRLANVVLNYLHDNDVVIKVDRELPKLIDMPESMNWGQSYSYIEGRKDERQDMLKARYVAVVPLIKK